MKKIAIFALVPVVALAIYLIKPYRISGDCMEPAIKDGNLYILDRVSPYLRKYKKGDIIIFTYEGKPWISRILALANDTIQIIDNTIKINGIDFEDHIDRNWNQWKQGRFGIDSAFEIPADHIFVLCDNLSSHHDDSRVFGPIPRNLIMGLVR